MINLKNHIFKVTLTLVKLRSLLVVAIVVKKQAVLFKKKNTILIGCHFDL